MTHQTEEDDPHDDSTNWAGNLPKANINKPERTDKRDTGRTKQPDVQRKEPPMEKGR